MNKSIKLEVTLTITGGTDVVEEIYDVLDMVHEPLLEDIVTIVEDNLITVGVGGDFETKATLSVTPGDS
jgi:RNA 3'-terminal phosphate cyclase